MAARRRSSVAAPQEVESEAPRRSRRGHEDDVVAETAPTPAPKRGKGGRTPSARVVNDDSGAEESVDTRRRRDDMSVDVDDDDVPLAKRRSQKESAAAARDDNDDGETVEPPQDVTSTMGDDVDNDTFRAARNLVPMPLELKNFESFVDQQNLSYTNFARIGEKRAEAKEGLEGWRLDHLREMCKELAAMKADAKTRSQYLTDELMALEKWKEEVARASVTKTGRGVQPSAMAVDTAEPMTGVQFTEERSVREKTPPEPQEPPEEEEQALTIKIKAGKEENNSRVVLRVPKADEASDAGHSGVAAGRSQRGGSGDESDGGGSDGSEKKQRKNQPKKGGRERRKRRRNSDEDMVDDADDALDEEEEEEEDYEVPVSTENRPELQLWNTVDAYFADITMDDLKDLLPQGERTGDPAFSIPTLGTHYGDAWDHEDARDMGTVPRRPKPRQKAVRLDDEDDDDEASTLIGSMTQRLMSALGEANGSTMRFEVDPTAQSETGPVAANSTGTSLSQFEDRVRMELIALGLLEDMEQPESENREDDEVCVEMRALQKKLTAQIRINNEKKARLYAIVCSKLAEQDRRKELKDADHKVLSEWRKHGGKKKQKKGRTIRAALDARKEALAKLSIGNALGSVAMPASVPGTAPLPMAPQPGAGARPPHGGVPMPRGAYPGQPGQPGAPHAAAAPGIPGARPMHPGGAMPVTPGAGGPGVMLGGPMNMTQQQQSQAVAHAQAQAQAHAQGQVAGAGMSHGPH